LAARRPEVPFSRDPGRWKGAVLGGAVGAAGGTAAVMAGGRNPATLPAGTVITARVAGPVTVQVQGE
jgi:hypothetical protein